MELVTLKLDEIKPYERNARKNDQAVDAVSESIRQCEYIAPIIVDENHIILAGHTRWKSLKKLGRKEAECVIKAGLSEEQKKKYRMLDNKTAELAEWDFDLLVDELDGLDFGELDLDWGVDGGDSEKPEASEDDYDGEPPKEPKAQIGDIYQLGRHRLMCGDSTDAECVALLMDGSKADMIFTDPPYNVDYASKNSFLNEADKGNRIQKDIEGDSAKTDEECGEMLWKPAFQNMRDNAKDDCSIYVTMPQGGAHMMMMMMCSASWQVKHELIWVKNNHVLGRTDYFYKHEPILFGWAKTHKFYGKGEFNKSVWEIDKPQKSDLHPTMKPIRLIQNCLLNSSQDNDLVLDLFGGSGSTMIACEQLNRKCYMMELDQNYIDVIIDRWEKFTGEKAVKLN